MSSGDGDDRHRALGILGIREPEIGLAKVDGGLARTRETLGVFMMNLNTDRWIP